MKIDHPTNPTSPRNYSLSDAPGRDHFRISVKREDSSEPDAPSGLISTYLHDRIDQGETIQVGPPCGEFTLDPNQSPTSPLVFLAGGIGVTPLLSMAKSVIDAQPDAQVYFLQAARNGAVHALSGEVRELGQGRDNARVHVIYDAPLEGDLQSGKCDASGTMSADLLRDWAPVDIADFYICGPSGMMQSVLSSLASLGVNASRVHHEFSDRNRRFSAPCIRRLSLPIPWLVVRSSFPDDSLAADRS